MFRVTKRFGKWPLIEDISSTGHHSVHLSTTSHLLRTYLGKLKEIHTQSQDCSLFFFTGECFEAKMNYRLMRKTQWILAPCFFTEFHIQKYLWTASHVPSTGLERDNSGMNLCILILLKWRPCLCKVLPGFFLLPQSLATCDVPLPHSALGLRACSKGDLRHMLK